MLGYVEVSLAGKCLADYFRDREGYIDREFRGEILENQYLLIRDNYGDVAGKYVFRKGSFIELMWPNAPKKIHARNVYQEFAIDMLEQDDIKVKVLGGVGGAGKDYLMINYALQAIEEKKYDKIVYIRNNIEVKNTNCLGSLPGDEIDKLLPFLMPLADHVGGISGLEYLISCNKLEAIHLGHARGRNVENAILYSTEAENLTKGHLKLLLTRVAEGSALWINGDNAQRDGAIFERSAGMEHMAEKLGGNKLFGYVNLPISERSEVARLAALLDDD